ncbi:MAG: FG-GAP repeat domain-containing protein [Myxococcota bacterium]
MATSETYEHIGDRPRRLQRRWGRSWSWVFLVVMAPVSVAQAADPTHSLPQPLASSPKDQGSLAQLIEQVASAVEQRASQEGVAGPVRFEVTAARGVDATKTRRLFSVRLERRLAAGKVLLPRGGAEVRLRVALSQEGTRVFVVAEFEGGPLPTASVVVVSSAVDRELEQTLGAGMRASRGRWGIERLGTVPAGVLDVLLHDVDGDLAEELVLLSVDGLRIYRCLPGDPSPRLLGGPFALPGEVQWPRLRSGWLAIDGERRPWVATNAGHRLVFDLEAGRFLPAPVPGVPLRQNRDQREGGAPLMLSGRIGTPLLFAVGPALDVSLRGVWRGPAALRDVQVLPAPASWLWNDESGQLWLQWNNGAASVLTGLERVGDRVTLADFDRDGRPELVSSAATGPDESDEIAIHDLDLPRASTSLRFRAPLSGGSIVAVAVGEIDLDGAPDLVVVEELPDGAVLWRVELAP